MAKTIYDLDLHENIKTTKGFPSGCIRVPGGWIYELYCVSNDSWNHIFVAFNNEFEEKENNEERIDIADWLSIHNISARLYNILFIIRENKTCIYVDEITKKVFMKRVNAGKASWIEFENLLNNE